MSTEIACLDACVIYPMGLCDTLLTLAETGLFRPVWSGGILAEVRRNLTRLPPADVDARLDAMDGEFLGARMPASAVASRLHLVPAEVDAGDRHVVAAALTADATAIVTANLRHFAPSVLVQRLGIEVVAPDEFLVTRFEADPASASRAVARQVARLRRPPRSVREHIGVVRPHLPEFASVLDAYFDHDLDTRCVGAVLESGPV